MTARDHALFQRYPLTGNVALSTGEAPAPYHIYAGAGVFIGGTADLAAVERLLAPEHLRPLRTTAGQALMGVWVCDFREASLGPHHELQLSLFVAPGPVAPLPAHPLSLLTAMLTHPDLHMLCHGLWNNSPVVVAYNRERLSLNARLTDSRIGPAGRGLAFEFVDAADRTAIAHGALGPGRAGLRATLALGAQIGFGRAQRLNQQPWVPMRVVNPVGVRLPRNAVAEAFTKNDANAVRYWDPRTDALTISAAPYAALGFTPRFVQLMTGFKFVYLDPR